MTRADVTRALPPRSPETRPRASRGRGVRDGGGARRDGRDRRDRRDGHTGGLRLVTALGLGTVVGLTAVLAGCGGPNGGGAVSRSYPWHTGIVSTTFWVGEVFDPDADDGSQVYSTYDDDWQGSYGGCDGVVQGRLCRTERRTAANGWFPRHMTPRENPFYLDVPYDDVNDRIGLRDRDRVVPWADDPAYRRHRGDEDFSYLKNRWVQLRKGTRTCYGQVQDAGPGTYHDSRYVFGTGNSRPANKRFNGAGMDVSPALNGCLGFAELDGEGDRISWRFVEAGAVPDGPWRRIVTTSQVSH